MSEPFRPVPNASRPNRKDQMKVIVYLHECPDILHWLRQNSEDFGISMGEVARQALRYAMKAE